MIPIKVPPLGESIVEATVSRWLKREGDSVAAGETLVELETDKVTVEVPATNGGVLVRRLHQEGDVVTLGTVLAELDETATASTGATPPSRHPPAPVASDAPPPPQPTAAAAPVPVPPSRAPQPPAPAPAPEAPPAAPTQSGTAVQQTFHPTPSGPPEVRSSPAARRLATDHNVDLAAIPGTGRGGVVSKPDVVEYLAHPAHPTPPAAAIPSPVASPDTQTSAPVAAGPATPPVSTPRPGPAPIPSPPPTTPGRTTRETREKMSTRRRRIAEHLLESQHATAHLTTFNEIDMSGIEALRNRVKEKFEKDHGVRLSLMPFFVRAACLALKQFPTVNARVDGDHIVFHHYVNMGIAVASDAGLVVPNLKDADSRNILQIAQDIVALARKARDGKLVMDDLTGGTFTITNGGVFGSLLSTPIINYPEVAILGLHKLQDRPVAVDGRIEIRPMMYVALSYDHRIIDGQQAVLFLVRVKELMEDPALMAIG